MELLSVNSDIDPILTPGELLSDVQLGCTSVRCIAIGENGGFSPPFLTCASLAGCRKRNA